MAKNAGSERAISAVIRGRVQGVGYRFTTQRIGERLGLAGWVRNESDGSVSVRAQGESVTISRFLGFLEEGPPAARVENIAVREEEPDPALSGFWVR